MPNCRVSKSCGKRKKRYKNFVKTIEVKNQTQKLKKNSRKSYIQPNRSHPGPGLKAGRGNLHRGREATDWGREEGGDDATKAGGGNLHRGRGATAWGREEGGDDAT